MATGSKTIVVTGSLGYDYIMNFSGSFANRIMPDKIHKISLSFLVDKLHKQFGGTAGNIAYSLHLLGINPLILSVAGNDFDPYRAFLHSAGLSTEYITEVPKEPTGSYFVVTDQHDNQIGSFYSGATKAAKSLSLATVTEPVDLVVVSPTDPPAMEHYVRQCQTLSLPYLFDPAFQIDSFTPKSLKAMISSAHMLIGNDYEIALIEHKLSQSHSALLLLVPILITTLGQKGATIETKSEKIIIPPAIPVNTSDPTGAGDAFRSGFLAGYLRGFDLATCGRMGAVAAVYTVEKYGTVTHSYTIGQFVSRFKKNYNQSISLN